MSLLAALVLLLGRMLAIPVAAAKEFAGKARFDHLIVPAMRSTITSLKSARYGPTSARTGRISGNNVPRF
jgi:hypothetical protein